MIGVLDSRAAEDETFRNKLEALYARGLFVKNLENVQGDERDLVILSITFGADEEGKFIQQFGPLNRAYGYRLLNVIISRAKSKLVIFNSIPREFTSSYRQLITEEGNSGKGIFYAYLEYARICSSSDVEQRRDMMTFLGGEEAEEDKSEVNSLVRYVSALLENRFAGRVTSPVKLGGYRYDILLETDSGKWAIDIDLGIKHGSKVDYLFDHYRELVLERMNIKHELVWSVHWWKHPKASLEQLIRNINLQG